SVIWAGAEGDWSTFLESLTLDGRAKIVGNMQKQNKSEEDVAADLKQSFAKLTGFTILQEEVLPDDNVMMRVRMDGAGAIHRYIFKHFGTQWRLSDTKDDER